MKKLIGQMGGKNLLVKELVKMIPYHEKYVEVFGGGATLLLKKERSYIEVYNDIDTLFYNFFMVVTKHPNELLKKIEYMPIARELFNQYSPRIKNNAMIYNENLLKLDPIEKAAIFYILKRFSFGKRGTHFMGGRMSSQKKIDEKVFWDTANRLKDVVIEKLSYEKMIPTHDGYLTFFYLDPPYYGLRNDYQGGGWEKKETHIKLSKIIKKIEGKWLLSYNANDFIRELYKEYTIKEVSTLYSFNNANFDKKKELNTNYSRKEFLICNYK